MAKRNTQDPRRAAQGRAQGLPGAVDPGGTLHGVPVSLLADANVSVVVTYINTLAKSQRALVRQAAQLVRAIERSATDLRDLAPRMAVAEPVSSPDTLEGTRAFHRAVVALCEAAKVAQRTIPPSAKRREPDEIDEAPTPGRLNRAMARAAVDAGVPPSPAGVRDLMVSWGLERPPVDSVDLVRAADKWKKALPNRKRPSRKVTGTVRRKK
jgi:hypothetical protein